MNSEEVSFYKKVITAEEAILLEEQIDRIRRELRFVRMSILSKLGEIDFRAISWPWYIHEKDLKTPIELVVPSLTNTVIGEAIETCRAKIGKE